MKSAGRYKKKMHLQWALNIWHESLKHLIINQISRAAWRAAEWACALWRTCRHLLLRRK